MEKLYNTFGFFTPRSVDYENLDYDHSETIPDQCLTVREILTNFTRSGRILPEIETGEDDDIDSPDVDFPDMVDAVDAVNSGYSEVATLAQYQKQNSVDVVEDSPKGEES